jgi:hypothetical protein
MSLVEAKKAFSTSGAKPAVVGVGLVGVFLLLVEAVTRAYWVMSNIERGPCLREVRDEFGAYCSGGRIEKTFWNFNTIWSDGIWNNGDWWWNHITGFSLVLIGSLLLVICYGLFCLGVWLADEFL